MSAKVTPWFAPTDKPSREGVYERRHGNVLRFSLWNGGYWEYSSKTASEANKQSGKTSYFQESPWRGLAKKP